MHKRSTLIEGLVVKRRNIGEADRLVTLFTPETGKLQVIAKSARTLKSRQRAALEPGTHVRGLLISSSSIPLLTQATLLDDCLVIHQSLPKLRQLSQLLEIVDSLFVEDQGDPELFELVMQARACIVTAEPTSGRLTQLLAEMVVALGYQHPSETQYASVSEYVAALADKPLRSWEYLKVE